MDDDSVPATTEWMLEQWETNEHGRPIIVTLPGTLTWYGERVWLAKWIPIMSEPTRGEVRALSKALRVPIDGS